MTQSIPKKRTALGFRAHSGWAAMVGMSGSGQSPRVVGRSRIELADPRIPRPVQPYHAAQKMELPEAGKYLTRFANDARRLAGLALQVARDRLLEEGYEVVACGMPLGSGRTVPSLQATLASHPLVHTAEGVLYRDAITSAAEALGLYVLAIPERDLLSRGAAELDFSINQLRFCLKEFGRPLGPPWGQDQKLAALAAWLALAS